MVRTEVHEAREDSNLTKLHTPDYSHSPRAESSPEKIVAYEQHIIYCLRVQPAMASKARYRTNADLLATVRKRTGISLRELSRQVGVTHTTIQRLEKGKDISAKAYVAIMLWVVMNNPNIAA